MMVTLFDLVVEAVPNGLICLARTHDERCNLFGRLIQL